MFAILYKKLSYADLFDNPRQTPHFQMSRFVVLLYKISFVHISNTVKPIDMCSFPIKSIKKLIMCRKKSSRNTFLLDDRFTSFVLLYHHYDDHYHLKNLGFFDISIYNINVRNIGNNICNYSGISTVLLEGMSHFTCLL